MCWHVLQLQPLFVTERITAAACVFLALHQGTADETMPKSSSDSIANFMHSPEWFQTNQRTSLKNQCVMPELWHFTSDVDRNVPAKTCTQNPGDLLLLPAQWGHATYNPSFVIG